MKKRSVLGIIISIIMSIILIPVIYVFGIGGTSLLTASSVVKNERKSIRSTFGRMLIRSIRAPRRGGAFLCVLCAYAWPTDTAFEAGRAFARPVGTASAKGQWTAPASRSFPG